MTALSWHSQQKATHTRALGTAQAFPLSGDGEQVQGLLETPERDPALLGVRLAEARYRDWRTQGELFARGPKGPAPELRLTNEEQSGQSGQLSRKTMPEAAAIVRELLTILEDSGLGQACAAERDRARAYLAREGLPLDTPDDTSHM